MEERQIYGSICSKCGDKQTPSKYLEKVTTTSSQICRIPQELESYDDFKPLSHSSSISSLNSTQSSSRNNSIDIFDSDEDPTTKSCSLVSLRESTDVNSENIPRVLLRRSSDKQKTTMSEFSRQNSERKVFSNIEKNHKTVSLPKDVGMKGTTYRQLVHLRLGLTYL